MIYEPAEDSYLLEKYVALYAPDKRVLDMGSGSGILANAARRMHARSVLAVDIDAAAIKHLKKQRIPAITSDLFTGVKGTFDLIVFNPTYLPEDVREDKESRRITTGGKRGDEIIIRFLEQVEKHLAKEGIILLLVSSLTPQKRIRSCLKGKKLKLKVLESEKLFMENLEVWEIC